jgi:hypothetical protein
MNSLFAWIATPMVAISALGAFVSAYNQSQMDAKLNAILTTCQGQSQGVGNLHRSQLEAVRYAS